MGKTYKFDFYELIGKTVSDVYLDEQNGGVLEINFTDGTCVDFKASYCDEWSTEHDATISFEKYGNTEI